MNEKLFKNTCLVTSGAGASHDFPAASRSFLSGRIFLVSLFFMFVLIGSAASVRAQPAMAIGELNLEIGYDECMRRIEQSYALEGWSIKSRGVGPFILAHKGNNAAYIICNTLPPNRTRINILVASLSSDFNVPHGERLILQARMGQAAAAGNNTGNFAGDWNATVQNGYSFTMSLRQDGNRVTGEHDGGQTIIEGVVTGNTLRFRYQYKNSSTKGAGTLILIDNGRAFTGFYSHTDNPDDRSKGSWNGTRR